MPTLEQMPQKLHRHGYSPSRVTQYAITVALNSEAIAFSLRHDTDADVLHIWGKAFDPDLDRVSQIRGLLDVVLDDLSRTLQFCRVRIQSVEVQRGHLLLNHASKLLTRDFLGRRGENHLDPRDDQSFDDTTANVEFLEGFDLVRVHCKSISHGL